MADRSVEAKTSNLQGELRHAAKAGYAYISAHAPTVHRLCNEAADEIERLTTALQVETICHQVASDSNRAKREEIELLKQQLFEARNDLDRLHDIMRGERAPAPESRDG